MEHPPLAWSYAGEPFDPPLDAVGWRVRRKLRPGKGSRTAPVFVEVDRIRVELVVELAAQVSHVHEAVREERGMYRLDPVDEDGWILRSEPGFVCVGGSSDSDLRLYPDLLAACTTHQSWLAYLKTLRLSDTEYGRFEALFFALDQEQFVDLRSDLGASGAPEAIKLLRARVSDE
jgi:hypothetical protein